jgi:hypothetical protein
MKNEKCRMKNGFFDKARKLISPHLLSKRKVRLLNSLLIKMLN